MSIRTLATGEQALDAIGASEFDHLWLVVIRVLTLLLAGDYDEARAHGDELLQRARAHANPSLLISALLYFAWSRRPDESDDTIEALEECLALTNAIASPYHPHAVRALGLLARRLSNHEERGQAVDACYEAVVRAYDTGQRPIMAFVVNHGVAVANDLGAWELAATLGAAVDEGPLAGLTTLIHPAEHIDRQVALTDVRAQLGAERYEAVTANAIAMTYQQLVEHALTELDRLRAETGDDAARGDRQRRSEDE
jgi:hypothetical protein